jgi:hypothetical protein
MNDFYILSSAYVKEGLQAEYGSIPPAFLPIGGRFLYQEQLAALNICTECVHLTLPEDFVLDKAQVNAINADNILVLRYSEKLTIEDVIKKCLRNSLEISEIVNVNILMGDTLIYDLDRGQIDFFSAHLPRTSQQWNRSNSKLDHVFSGFLKLTPKISKKILNEKFSKNFIRNNELIQCLSSEGSGFWYDLGHISEFMQTRNIHDTSRSFNCVVMNEHTVTKSSDNEQKLKHEYNWYRKLPTQLSIHTPKLLSSKIVNRSYILEKIPLVPLSEIACYGRQSSAFWFQIMDSFSKLLDDFSEYRPGDIELNYTKFIKEKTSERSASFPVEISKLLKKRIIINETEYQNFYDLNTKLSLKFQNLLLKHDEAPCICHGDLCFSNTFYDNRANLLKVIDPRGSFGNYIGAHGYQSYDIVKLAHSSLASYDEIIGGLYYLKRCSDYEYTFEIYSNHNQEAISRLFKDVILQRRNIPLRKLYANLFHLFSSMIPLHSDNVSRQLAFYFQALKFGSEALRC